MNTIITIDMTRAISPANEQVAHDRGDDDPPDGSADPLQEAGGEKLRETLGRHRYNRCEHEKRMPIKSGRRRPKRSASGPQMS